MSEQLRESMSAAMDEEADAFELRRVLDEAKENGELREQWHRFHIMRDLMQNPDLRYSNQLRENIKRALQEPQLEGEAEEELILALAPLTTPPQRKKWLARVGGTAVAAGVAMLVIVNGGVFDVNESPEFAQAQFETPTLGATQNWAAAPVLYQQATELDKQRQNALMLRHIQQRAMNQASMTSFVKLATFDTATTAPTVSDDKARR